MLDLRPWAKVPVGLMIAGGILAALGLAMGSVKDFAFSWLHAFMFFLSLGLGGLFLTIIHHLVDANWSVPIRRITENLARLLFPSMFILFLPILVLGPRELYLWMTPEGQDHALHAKSGYLNIGFWYVRVFAVFGVWYWLSSSFSKWSLAQDKDGEAKWSGMMKRLSGPAMFLFAFSLTIGAIDWMKALQHQWFSTMYGVYYFAESVWVTLATVYLMSYVLKYSGPLKDVVNDKTFYANGTLLFAFTVFYAYIHFSQYFLIWNAAIPEETFWYTLREVGSWKWIGVMLIVGHFVLPFLALLRIDVKKSIAVMTPICIWAWMMHFCDMSYNIMPVRNPEGFHVQIADIGCLMLFAGFLSRQFIHNYLSGPAYPQMDPRIAETMETYVKPLSECVDAEVASEKA